MANPLLGLTVVKKFTYRGDATEEWSNTYHFTAPPPTNSTTWKQVADDLIRNEKTVYPATSSVVRVYGYDNDDPKAYAVFTYDYEAAGESVPGTCPPPTSSVHVAGDQAAMIQAKMDHRNSRGKNTYLRKYFHDGWSDLNNHDNLAVGYKAALQNWADALVAGAVPSLGRWRARPYDSPVIAHNVDPFITTRTLKRRGKRPPTPA